VCWRLEKADNDRLSGLIRLHDLMQQRGEDGRPMLLVFDGCQEFQRTLPLLVADPKRPEDIDSSGEDHIYDESRYAAMSSIVKHPTRAKAHEHLPQHRGKKRPWTILRMGL
jgi:hypothetical protein